MQILSTRKLSESQVDEIASLYKSGRTSVELAEKYGCSYSTILVRLKERGIAPRSHQEARREYTLNESAFDVITEESAYWIGFLMADGCVYEPKQKASAKINLTLAKCDASHIENYRKFLGASNKLYHDRGAVCLTVTSARLAKALAKYGVTPRKSFTAKAIKLEHNKDFWRGVIDGDGCISAKGAKRRLELIGSLALMQQFAAFVERNIGGYKPTVITRRGY